MITDYDVIYLSPHLDDVVLSCGGQIYQQTQAGKRVLIATVTAGDPPVSVLSDYAQSLQERWELITDAGAARREEDRAACAILGADFQHWDVADCIYRYDPKCGDALYLSDDDIFGDVHPAEKKLVDGLAQRMTHLPQHDIVYAPLTVGHHVDHLLTRVAAERVFKTNIVYYEDYPYAQEKGMIEAVMAQSQISWTSRAIELTEAAMQAKIAAILAYRSQLSTFWTDHADLERQIRGYAAVVGGERVWQAINDAC